MKILNAFSWTLVRNVQQLMDMRGNSHVAEGVALPALVAVPVSRPWAAATEIKGGCSGEG